MEHWFKPIAYAFILLRLKAYACIFYPDLFGAHYTDKGGDGNDCKIFIDIVQEIKILLKVRRENAHGFQRDYFDSKNCVGWTYEGGSEMRGCAVLISNNGDAEKVMQLGKHYSGRQFYDVLGRIKETVEIDEMAVENFQCLIKMWRYG